MGTHVYLIRAIIEEKNGVQKTLKMFYRKILKICNTDNLKSDITIIYEKEYFYVDKFLYDIDTNIIFLYNYTTNISNNRIKEITDDLLKKGWNEKEQDQGNSNFLTNEDMEL